MLNPSERVTLIAEVARRLGAEDWPLIDLTLRQFSFPVDDDWRGDKEPYVIAMVEGSADGDIVALARHVGYDYSSARPSVEPGFWRPGYLRLFLSHLSAAKDSAGELQKHLLRFGVSAFVAHNDIEPTKEWQDEIQVALATCDALLALLHPGFHVSNWTDQEIGYVMGRQVLIIAARFGQDPYGFIGRFQAVQGEGKEPEVLARELLDILLRHRLTRKRMAEALVALLEQADSFPAAKSRTSLLGGVDYWDATLTQRVRAAVEANGQVREAWGVPARLETLIARMEGGADG